MFKNNPLFFIHFLFLNIQLFIATAVFCWNTIKVVFSEERSFSKTQLVKPTFSIRSSNTFLKRWRHFGFWAISAETTIFIVFPGFHCFGHKKMLGQNSVHENARFFSLPDTNRVSQFLLFFSFLSFLDDHLENTIFIGFCGLFPFCFFPFLFLLQQHKMQFSIRKPHFWYPDNFAKTLFGTNWHCLRFNKNMPKNYINGENSAQTKNLDQYLTQLLDQLLTQKTKSWTSFLLYNIYIYTRIKIELNYFYLFSNID